MAATRRVHASRSSRSYQELRQRSRMQKKAIQMLHAGKSYREINAETGIPKSTLGDLKKSTINNEQYAPVSEKRKIQIQVLIYVIRELLKKPKKYRRRTRDGKKTNWAVVSWEESREYLEKHWETAHDRGQPGLLNKSWIPGKTNYYDLLQKIPSFSEDRKRRKISNHGGN